MIKLQSRSFIAARKVHRTPTPTETRRYYKTTTHIYVETPTRPEHPHYWYEYGPFPSTGGSHPLPFYDLWIRFLTRTWLSLVLVTTVLIIRLRFR
jgi:hypothetical protein